MATMRACAALLIALLVATSAHGTESYPAVRGGVRPNAPAESHASRVRAAEQADRDARTGALVLALTGTAVLGIGLLVLELSTPVACNASSADGCTGSETGAKMGLGMTLSGLLLAPVGWIMYADTFPADPRRTASSFPGVAAPRVLSLRFQF